jgi:hypothetical protein
VVKNLRNIAHVLTVTDVCGSLYVSGCMSRFCRLVERGFGTVPIADIIVVGTTCTVLVISGFRRDADEICALLGYNAASSGNPLPMFRENLSVPYSRVKKSYSSWTS